MSLVPIDGAGKVLGQAGPCFIRNSNRLTVIGIMKFDTADLPNMQANGTLNDVILHEMGHVLGFGSSGKTRSNQEFPSPAIVNDNESPDSYGLQSTAAAAGQSLHGASAGL